MPGRSDFPAGVDKNTHQTRQRTHDIDTDRPCSREPFVSFSPADGRLPPVAADTAIHRLHRTRSHRRAHGCIEMIYRRFSNRLPNIRCGVGLYKTIGYLSSLRGGDNAISDVFSVRRSAPDRRLLAEARSRPGDGYWVSLARLPQAKPVERMRSVLQSGRICNTP